MEAVIYDSWQFGILDKSDLVDMIRVGAPHQQVLVEVSQVRHEVLRHKIVVVIFVEILDF